MKTTPIEFKHFKTDVKCKINNIHNPQIVDELPRSPRNSDINRTPQKPPTSFRELSGSRDKHKLFSGKKGGLENKLNTLRENEKNASLHNGDHYSKNEEIREFGSEKKEGLFKRLLSSRSPNSFQKVLNFDETKVSSECTSNDSNSTISFSAFKDITINEENLKNSDMILKKASSAGEKLSDEKGLKFKKFPHKRQSGNGTEKIRSPQKYLNFGPIISDKSKSKNKNENIKPQSPTNNPTKESKTFFQPFLQKTRTFSGADNNFIPFNPLKSNSTLGNEPDEVIRSLQGSMSFDMSPTLF